MLFNVGFGIIVAASVLLLVVAAGAAWYMTLARQWVKAAGIPVDAAGKAKGNGSPSPPRRT